MQKNYRKKITSSITKESEDAGIASRMQFFRQFMTAANIGTEDIGTALGCSPLTVRRWVSPSGDDAPLSSCMAAMEKFGYSLRIIMARSGEEEAEEDIFWRRNAKAKFKADRLSFLSLAMLRYDITSKALAAKMGLHYTTVDHMFRVNDMMISRIYRIADALDMSLFFFVEPLADAEANGPMQRVTVNINIPIDKLARSKEDTEEAAED